jgi:hypothetical protein
MRLRVVLLVSLGINLALAGALFYALSYPPSTKPARLRTSRQSTNVSSFAPGTNALARRQPFTWREIESTDYHAYITNLRSIGCPEPTIRDIIVADVNALYDRRRASEIVTPEQQWWRTDPDREVTEAAEKQLAALETERRALLIQLLGPNWEPPNSSELVELNTHLDGPVLGKLSPQTKQLVRDIENRAFAKRQAYVDEQQRAGKALDAADMVRLRMETRNELAKVLNEQQLEEYLLRYSQTAEILRSELRSLDTKPNEFRALFRARDALEQNALLHFNGNDAASLKQRQMLEQQREDAMKQLLGPDRYSMYRVAQDPLFQRARASVEQIGAPAETVLPLFQINQATELERQRIQADTNLSLEERALALANMLKQQQESLRRVLGDTVYQRYQQQGR